MVTLGDIRLRQYTLETLPLLRQLHAQLQREPVQVCIERARFVTQFLRELSADVEPMELRYARAVHHYLASREPLFPDANLLAGTTTSKPVGAPVYPETDGLAIWPELQAIGSRPCQPQLLADADADELNRDIFPYWLQRTVAEVARSRQGQPGPALLERRPGFAAAAHAAVTPQVVPDYAVVLQRGARHLVVRAGEREAALTSIARTEAQQRQIRFYRAVQIALEGAIAYAASLSQRAAKLATAEPDAGARARLEQLADICAWVPGNAPRTFREAVNSLWLIHIALRAGSPHLSFGLGRLDQLLYPFYSRDIEAGSLTVPQALELLGCLFLKLADSTVLRAELDAELSGSPGTAPAITIGGIDARGEDAVNDLTYLLLRAGELLGTPAASLHVRYHVARNPPAFLHRALEVGRRGGQAPALCNDVAAIEVLARDGMASEHARDYAIAGSAALTVPGRRFDAGGGFVLNLAAALELTLHGGRWPRGRRAGEQLGPPTGEAAAWADFGSFWAAFRQQLGWLVAQIVAANEALEQARRQLLPTPLLAALYAGPLETGTDLSDGGASCSATIAAHAGFAEVVDSLSAIETALCADRVCTFAELVACLRDDFAGHEKLHAYLTSRPPRYGTGDPLAARHAQAVLELVDELYHQLYQRPGEGCSNRYLPGYWSLTAPLAQGLLTGALPDGRRAFRPFAGGITPTPRAAAPVAVRLRAAAELGHRHAPGGAALNLPWPDDAEGDPDACCEAVRSFFAAGGLQIQFGAADHREPPHAGGAAAAGVAAAAGARTVPVTAWRWLSPRHWRARAAGRHLRHWLRHPAADGLLDSLLALMQGTLAVDADFRRQIAGFQASYLFRCTASQATRAVSFRKETMEWGHAAAAEADVIVEYGDERSLATLFFSARPDLLEWLRREDVAICGNRNYLCKFAYMAEHLRRRALAQP